VPDMAAVMRAVSRTDVIALPGSGSSEPAWTLDELGTDAALIERSLTEPELFSEVFDRYYAEIHGYVSRRLGSSLADDVASETFLIAFDRRRRYDAAHPSARPWLYGIASNLVSRHHRAELRRYRALARSGVFDVVDGMEVSRRGSTQRRCAGGSPLRSSRSRIPTARSCSWSHGVSSAAGRRRAHWVSGRAQRDRVYIGRARGRARHSARKGTTDERP
jgi:Sigma-70 region 2